MSSADHAGVSFLVWILFSCCAGYCHCGRLEYVGSLCTFFFCNFLWLCDYFRTKTYKKSFSVEFKEVKLKSLLYVIFLLFSFCCRLFLGVLDGLRNIHDNLWRYWMFMDIQWGSYLIYLYPKLNKCKIPQIVTIIVRFANFNNSHGGRVWWILCTILYLLETLVLTTLLVCVSGI